MMLVKASPPKFQQLRQSVSAGEALFLLGAIAFVLFVLVYADSMRVTVGGENIITFSRAAGFYADPFALTLDSPGRNTEIRYTLDGQPPDGASPRYEKPLFLDKTTIVKAVALRAGQPVGQLQAQSYFINEKSTLPVVSLITDPADLWDEKRGIYVLGTPDENAQEKFVPNDMRRGPEWHRTAYMEFFDEEGHQQFAIEGKIKIHGNATRRYPQKSLRFCATGGEYMEYQFFADSEVEAYKCILLRNGGNDWKDTMFRDSLVQSLVSETALDIQHAQPAIVYLNGEYWGIHNLRDTYNDYYFHTKYGLDRGDIAIIFPERDYNGYPIVEEGVPGDEKPYVDMLQFVQAHDMAQPSNYAYVESLMDVDNYIDYMSLNIYTNNDDWFDTNLRIWRYKNETGDFRDAQLPYGVDGKWRWIVYDMDSAMIAPVTEMTLARSINATKSAQEWTTILFRNLLKNPEFRSKFINRYIYHTNYTFNPARVLSRINEYQGRLRPEIERHIAKWGGISANGEEKWTSFKNVEEWEERVQVMRDFATHRQDYALHHLSDQFALAGVATLRVNLAEGGNAIHIGDLRIEQDGWTGNFIKGLVYPVSVESKLGYRFAGWESNVAMTTPTELRVESVDEVVLTAKFEKDLLGKFLSALGIRI